MGHLVGQATRWDFSVCQVWYVGHGIFLPSVDFRLAGDEIGFFTVAKYGMWYTIFSYGTICEIFIDSVSIWILCDPTAATVVSLEP